MSILLLRNCKNHCILGNAIFLSSLNLHIIILCITFALGNKCKIYESDRYITMSQQKGENEPYLVVWNWVWLLFFAYTKIVSCFVIRRVHIKSHCKDNWSPIRHCIWIEPESELYWTWIGAATTIHRKNDIEPLFNVKKSFFTFFLSPVTVVDYKGVMWWQEIFLL